MLHYDYAVKVLNGLGFAELENTGEYAHFIKQTKRGTLDVHFGYSASHKVNAIVCKPNGTSKYLNGKTDSQFSAAIRQTIAFNEC